MDYIQWCQILKIIQKITVLNIQRLETFKIDLVNPRIKVKNWFYKQGFNKVNFGNDNNYTVTTYWLNKPVVFKLSEIEGFSTFYTEGSGGGLIVFEVKVEQNVMTYNCYCPILLFGFWNIKLSFKKNAGWITKYRKEGYFLNQKFKEFLKSSERRPLEEGSEHRETQIYNDLYFGSNAESLREKGLMTEPFDSYLQFTFYERSC